MGGQDNLRARGATVWFTGLSGSGKSTLARATEERLVSQGTPAYVLDGDDLRSGLCAGLGFEREARDENVRRVAEVAKLFADAGLVSLVALISPYASGRTDARMLHEGAGLSFVEVHMATPVALCAARDPKGLYARASSGGLSMFTGVDDPYEEPVSPDLVVRGDKSVESTVDDVLAVLKVALASRPANHQT